MNQKRLRDDESLRQRQRHVRAARGVVAVVPVVPGVGWRTTQDFCNLQWRTGNKVSCRSVMGGVGADDNAINPLNYNAHYTYFF